MANNPDGLDDWSRDFTWLNGQAVRYDKYGTPRAVEVTGQYGSPVALTQQMYYAQQGNVVEADNSGARGYSASMPTQLENPLAGYVPDGKGGYMVADPTDPATKSAVAIIQSTLSDWGLSSLAPLIDGLIKDFGPSNSEAIFLNLKKTPEWQTRFAANAARTKAGLRELSPAEYIAAENSYRQVLQSYGLPSTFYDSQDDYRKFLELDVSPTELNDRAKVAQTTWLGTDQATKDVWAQWYGLSDGAAIAAILDPSKALPIIQSMAEAAKAGGVAVRNGLQANESRIRGYIDQGISGDKIAQGFSDIGAVHGTDQAIGSRFGINLDQATEEASRIQGLASARRAQAEAYGAEQALFDSRASADAKSLNRRTAGSF
jgi:hypothetical protein